MNAVDFEVRPGELRSVIGPNGAGKSTFFKLIAGELPPTTGRVLFDGVDVTREPQFARSQRGIAKSYQITEPGHHRVAARELEAEFVARLFARGRIHQCGRAIDARLLFR